MSSFKSRLAGAGALTAAALALAVPGTAGAATGGDIKLSIGGGGKTAKSLKKVKFNGAAGAIQVKAAGATTLTFPVTALDTGAGSAGSTAGLALKRGGDKLGLRELKLTGLGTAATQITAAVGKKRPAIFTAATTGAFGAGAGAAVLEGAPLLLTKAGAKLLASKLDLRKRPKPGVAGTFAISASTPVPVKSGVIEWGVRASFRSYVVNAPPPGTVTATAPATVNGVIATSAGFFAFPVTGGQYQKGLGGVADTLTVAADGGANFGKAGHCIMDVSVYRPRVSIAATGSGLTADTVNDIDTFAGGCVDAGPPSEVAGVPFADLVPAAPAYADGGKSVTWAAIPSTLTASGAANFAAGGMVAYPPGDPMDAVTVRITTG